MSSPQSQSVVDLPKILAVGIASPAATLLTSRFGVAGTLIGLVLSAMFLTFAADILKVYLARIPGAVTTIPGGLRKKSFFRRGFEKMKIPFSKFGSLPRPRRRSILIRSALAAGISILVGLIIVTALELGVGKSLSCLVWEECSAESSAQSSSRTSGGGGASTLPSILGGGQSAGSSAPQGGDDPSNPQQQPGVQQQPGSSPGTPQAPSPEEAAPANPDSVQPGQRQGPAGVPQEEEDQQQQPSPDEAPKEKQKGSADQQKDSMDNPSES